MIKIPNNIKVSHMEKTLHRGMCFAIETKSIHKINIDGISGWNRIKQFFSKYINKKYDTTDTLNYFRLTDNYGSNAFFYFKYAEDAQYLIDEIPKDIISIRKPLTQECYDDMLDGKNISIKKKLFHNKYRYKVEFHPIFGLDNINEFKTSLIDYFGEEETTDKYKYGKGIKTDVKTTFYGHTWWKWNKMMYIAEDDDIAVLSLMFSDKIKNITKVKLFTEFNDLELKQLNN